MSARARAVHILLDLHDCNANLLHDADRLRQVLHATAKESGLTALNEVFHSFQPHGVSGVLLIAESHISIHTWPEKRFAAVDVFSCNPKITVSQVRNSLEQKLQPARVDVRVIERGEIQKEEREGKGW